MEFRPRDAPDGRLPGFERNKLRAWSVYDWSLGPYGALSLSGLWRVDSGLAYSLAAGNGNAHAPGYRDDLARQMTPAQIADAQKRAREWRPKGK
jgi:hypothetical protein